MIEAVQSPLPSQLAPTRPSTTPAAGTRARTRYGRSCGDCEGGSHWAADGGALFCPQVGHENLFEYFAIIDRMLKPGGRAVIQAITYKDEYSPAPLPRRTSPPSRFPAAPRRTIPLRILVPRQLEQQSPSPSSALEAQRGRMRTEKIPVY
jgi:hypothetical protein